MRKSVHTALTNPENVDTAKLVGGILAALCLGYGMARLDSLYWPTWITGLLLGSAIALPLIISGFFAGRAAETATRETADVWEAGWSAAGDFFWSLVILMTTFCAAFVVWGGVMIETSIHEGLMTCALITGVMPTGMALGCILFPYPISWVWQLQRFLQRKNGLA